MCVCVCVFIQLHSLLMRMFFLPYALYMVVFCLFVLFVVCSLLFFICLSRLCPFLATMSFDGYFLVRFFLSAFPAFFSPTVFPVWFGSVPSML